MKEQNLTTDELLERLPSFININIGFICKEYTYGVLGITKQAEGMWEVAYRFRGRAVCLNHKDDKPPYKNATKFGHSAKEALKKMYEWLIENKLID